MKRQFVTKAPPNAPKPISSAPVCVTGATGYIAMHIVERLLVRGYNVRGTVRSSNSEKAQILKEFQGANEQLELFEADLQQKGSFKEAIDGCEYVLHTASPFFIETKKPYDDLINPALNGTENVLNTCVESKVKKVVLTSSVAAVNQSPMENKVFNEDDWNTGSTPQGDPYPYSKTVAEKKAWEIQEANPSMELVTINPGLVCGPSHFPRFSQSLDAIRQTMEGKELPAILNIGWAIVDVRDVADAHILALENPNAKGRHICCNESVTMRQLADRLRKLFPRYNIPTMGMDGSFGSGMVRLSSYFMGSKGRYIRTVVGKGAPHYDNSKIKKELGLEFIDLDHSLMDTVNYLVESEQLADFRG